MFIWTHKWYFTLLDDWDDKICASQRHWNVFSLHIFIFQSHPPTLEQKLISLHTLFSHCWVCRKSRVTVFPEAKTHRWYLLKRGYLIHRKMSSVEKYSIFSTLYGYLSKVTWSFVFHWSYNYQKSQVAYLLCRDRSAKLSAS